MIFMKISMIQVLLPSMKNVCCSFASTYTTNLARPKIIFVINGGTNLHLICPLYEAFKQGDSVEEP